MGRFTHDSRCRRASTRTMRLTNHQLCEYFRTCD
jgi:hypothetical protein